MSRILRLIGPMLLLGTLNSLSNYSLASTADPSSNSINDAGSTRILASSAGAALNSNLLHGGGTDDTLALQRALDAAKQGRGVHLIIDGPALVGGLDVHSNTTIECTSGGGLYLRDRAHRALIRNTHRTKHEVIDRNISLLNCFLNGNADGQAIVGPLDSVFRASQEPDGTFISGLQFFGVHNLMIDNARLWNIRSFGVWVANAKFIQLRDVTVDIGAPPFPEGEGLLAAQNWLRKHARSTDGLHFCGPIQYLTIDGALLRTTDDGLSLGTDDASVVKENAMGPYIGSGPITDATISNVLFMGGSHAIRLLSATNRMDRIVITNLSGTVRERMAVISPFLVKGEGNFGSIIFSNVAVDLAHSYPRADLYLLANQEISPEATAATDNWNWRLDFDEAEESDLPLFSLNGRIENLQLRQVVTKGIAGRPLIRVGKYATIGSLTADLSIHDPKFVAIPMTLLGKIDRLNVFFDWEGTDPIKYQGGSIKLIRQLEPR